MRSNIDFCCFYPILVTWFLVVFGDAVTKILRNSLFFISSCPSCLANGKHHTENHATKVTKLPKTMLPKYVMSRAYIDISDAQYGKSDLNKKANDIKEYLSIRGHTYYSRACVMNLDLRVQSVL